MVRHDGVSNRLRAMGVGTIVNSADTPEWGAAIRDATGGVASVVDTIAVGSGVTGAMYRALRDQVEASGEKPVVDRRFAFGEARDALRALKAPGGFGKIVVDVA